MVFHRILLYLFLLTLAAIFVGPFIWLLSNALKPVGANIFVYPPQIIPNPITLENFAITINQFPFLRYSLNSALIAIGTVVLNLILCSLAAYPLARMRFPGRNLAFYAILSTMMIPFHAILITLFGVIILLRIDGSYAGVILPFAVTGFGIFLLRQAFLGIPHELEDAARIDGCGDFCIFYRIMLPLIQPALGTLALFIFVISWNEFLWPFIVLKDPDMWTQRVR